LIHESGHDRSSYEPPSFKKSPRKFSAGVTKARAASGSGPGGKRTRFQNGGLKQQDENQMERGKSKEPVDVEEVKSLKFELQQ